MTKEEFRENIKRDWKTSSGDKITKMLLRYWKLEESVEKETEKRGELVKYAEELFRLPVS